MSETDYGIDPEWDADDGDPFDQDPDDEPFALGRAFLDVYGPEWEIADRAGRVRFRADPDRSEWYDQEGVLHRVDGPAVIAWRDHTLHWEGEHGKQKRRLSEWEQIFYFHGRAVSREELAELTGRPLETIKVIDNGLLLEFSARLDEEQEDLLSAGEPWP